MKLVQLYSFERPEMEKYRCIQLFHTSEGRLESTDRTQSIPIFNFYFLSEMQSKRMQYPYPVWVFVPLTTLPEESSLKSHDGTLRMIDTATVNTKTRSMTIASQNVRRCHHHQSREQVQVEFQVPTLPTDTKATSNKTPAQSTL